MRFLSNHIILVGCLLGTFILISSFNTTAEELDVRIIIDRIDDLYRSESSYGTVEMEIVTPHWQRTLAMNVWTYKLEKTFIRITAPKKEADLATLRVGNEMWNYLPKVNKVIKIPPSMMMSSWMGSDFTNDDIVKEFTLRDDYTYELITPDDPDENLICIKFIPKEERPIVWGSIVVAARRLDYIPVWERFYDEKDKLMRIMEFKDIMNMGGRRIPATMEMTPMTKQGHKTVIRYVSVTFDTTFSGDVFSLRHLHSR